MNREGGIGFLGLLTIALIVLKITGYVDSWWWVFAPIWIPLGFISLIFGIPLLIAGILSYLEGR